MMLIHCLAIVAICCFGLKLFMNVVQAVSW